MLDLIVFKSNYNHKLRGEDCFVTYFRKEDKYRAICFPSLDNLYDSDDCYQVGQTVGKGDHVAGNHQDVPVRPEQRHGAGDVGVLVHGGGDPAPPDTSSIRLCRYIH